MAVLKRNLLMIIVLSALIGMPCYALKMHQADTKLKFEISKEEQQWFVGSDKFPKGPIKPLYTVELFIRNLPQEQYKSKSASKYRAIKDFSSYETIKILLQSPDGQSMSQQQRDLVTTGDVICQIGKLGGEVGNHTHFRLYAATRDDAPKIAKAFLDFLIAKANRNLKPLLTQQRQLEEKIADHSKSIANKEAKLKTARAELDKLKKTVHYLTAGEAKNAVSKLNSTVEDLEIKLAAMRAKYNATNQALLEERRNKLSRNDFEEKLTQLNAQLQAAKSENENISAVRHRAVAKLKAVQTRLDQLKKTVYGLSTAGSKNKLLDLYKIVDDIGVMFAEAYTELDESNKSQKQKKEKPKVDIEFGLTETLRDQKAELETLEARKEASVALRESAEKFYYLNQQILELRTSKKSLSDELLDSTNALSQIEEKLANPMQELLPPEVYQNKATIYPLYSGDISQSNP